MKALLQSFLFFLIFNITVLPQNIEYPSIILQDISFRLQGSGYPDTIQTLKIKFENSETITSFNILLDEGSFEHLLLTLNSTGSFRIVNEAYNEEIGNTRALPGLLSILPPALAILLALIFRQVLFSSFGTFTGAFFIYSYDPLTAFLRTADVYRINALKDKSHMQVIVFTLLFGGVIGLISKSGGTRGIANSIINFAKSRKSGLYCSWLAGIIIFFDDYANSLSSWKPDETCYR